MSELVSSIMSSAQTISSPESSIAIAIDPLHPATDTQVPVVADFLELSAFFSPNASDYSPEQTAEVRNKINDINKYIGEQFPDVPNEDQVKEYLADIITRNKLDRLSPSDKLEAIHNYLDMSKRILEIKDIKAKIKALRA